MRKICIFLLLLGSVCLYGQKPKSPGFHWRNSLPGELPAAASEFFPLEKGKAMCYLSNNDKFIFVDMVITDPGIQKKILEVGMNVWIDASGKGRKSISVRYPVGSITIKNQLERKGDRMTGDEIQMYTRNSSIAMAYEIYYKGFGEGGTIVIPAMSDDGCMASLKYNDDGELLYFLSIPVDELTFESSKGATVPFSIGIEYGVPPVIERPRPQQGGTGAASMPTAARSGTRSGGAQGGGAPGASPGATSSDQAIWIKGLSLATGVK